MTPTPQQAALDAVADHVESAANSAFAAWRAADALALEALAAKLLSVCQRLTVLQERAEGLAQREREQAVPPVPYRPEGR